MSIELSFYDSASGGNVVDSKTIAVDWLPAPGAGGGGGATPFRTRLTTLPDITTTINSGETTIIKNNAVFTTNVLPEGTEYVECMWTNGTVNSLWFTSRMSVEFLKIIDTVRAPTNTSVNEQLYVWVAESFNPRAFDMTRNADAFCLGVDYATSTRTLSWTAFDRGLAHNAVDRTSAQGVGFYAWAVGFTS